MTLTDFLLARIAEDEEVAHAAGEVLVRLAGGGSTTGMEYRRDEAWKLSLTFDSEFDETGSVDTHPARVLAECEAKRRIVERHTIDCYPEDEGDHYICDHCGADGWNVYEVLCSDLLDLAAVHADHPDYRDEWRP